MKTRKDCFFGLHFDFHAMKGDSIGSVIDTETIEKMLDATCPDMIQVDSKGHPGISSYATEAGYHPEKMNMDVLKVWRELTAKRGIRLYAHHSGLFDFHQAEAHPDWVSLDENGSPNGLNENHGGFVSPFSPYVDEVLIPQLKEIAGTYKADGVWVDGESWGVFADYSPWAKKAWFEKTGKEAPKSTENGYEDYREFCREGFRKYVAHYIKEVKADYPDFEITSNWMYSHFTPEKRTVPIDFISGDYDCDNSVNYARDTGRCIVAQNHVWDLMAWGQNAKPLTWITRNRCTKEAPQLCQEAAVVLALGGGFQFFNILYGTGGLVQEWAIDGWAEVANFCHCRREYCFQAESIAEIGIIYPEYYGKNTLFTGGAFKNLRAWVSMIQDAGFSCDVINESSPELLSRHKVIVLPGADIYNPNTIKLITEFADNGGIVIVDGGVELSADISGTTFKKPVRRLVFPDCDGRLTCLETNYFEPALSTASPLIYCYKENYFREEEKYIACTVNQYGKGKILSMCFDISTVYNDNITYALKQFTKKLFRESGYQPFVSVTGSDYADVTLMQKDGKVMINIINKAGEHNAVGVRTFNEIPKIGPLEIHIRSDKMPKSVIRRPENIKLDMMANKNGYTYKIDSLHIHSVIEVEL